MKNKFQYLELSIGFYFYLMALLQENQDKIFLGSDYKTLSKTFEFAAQNGNLENMKWLKEQGCPWDPYTFSCAVQNGNLENMKWLREQGCPWDSDTFKVAAENGNLENMKWLREQGCPWNEWTFAYATRNGNLENMKWLKEQGCPNNNRVNVWGCLIGKNI